MERFINILVIDNNPININDLQKMLLGAGNNLIFCQDEESAFPELEKRKFGIILINIQSKCVNGFELLQRLKSNPNSKDAYKIVISQSTSTGAGLVKGFREGAVDYISTPFNENLVKAKIEVFKSLYFKDLRISQLLENIFPQTILKELRTVGKFTQKKIGEGVVLFTDFIAFTQSAKDQNPLDLLQELEMYFNKFDEIMERYNLEKIKTIGDAYMALGGVTEKNSKPAVRATLAALEIRNYVLSKKQLAIATNRAYWNIRIGLHLGPLVAGVIGTKKISYDVWGNTVNIAARAEQNSKENCITVTHSVAEQISEYFDVTHRGEIQLKYGNHADMFFVDQLKTEHSLFNEGKLPNRKLRVACELAPMDFEFARRFIITKLKSSLPDELDYHNIKHTLNVEKAAIRIAKLEGVKGEELILLRTAVLFHDAGFIFRYSKNESFGIKMAEIELKKFGYSEEQIETICNIISATRQDLCPVTLLEKIMCDADHDYLGRADYHNVAKTLRHELANYGHTMKESEWIDFQINYLENVHQYFTQTSKNIRERGKLIRINELKKLRKLIHSPH
ncbi:adenylate/guanylate cyclase domain-containing protein [Brumimicrobium oceani]|uniref:Guanylate cyclase n=1 Tax=Brumimicrobium oceani TaxID=2100725 RepID=A0A2U2XFP2_9FLAO|nr:adenylate/guanylate cyclase domain-containing protein [Brumimicrobium oceani]PWH86560.1 guanylate cyclase [Brumimicrobium oceani]